MNYVVIVIFGVILLLSGCGDTASSDSKPDSTHFPPQVKPERSTSEMVIGGFTGQKAIEIGKETRAKLEAIGKKEKAAMDEILP